MSSKQTRPSSPRWAKPAAAAGRQVEDVSRRAGSIIGGLDGRGWNLGAVQARWSGARGQFTQLIVDLSAMAIDLADRATLVVLFETGPGFGMAPGEKLPGYAGNNLAALDAILFPPHGFTEKKYSKELDWLLGGKPTAQRLAKLKGSLPDVLLPTAAAMAERAQQVALHGSPAGIRRRINALDKLDPTATHQLNLIDANAVVYGFAVGGKEANFSAEILAVHGHATAGLSLDIQRRRFSATFDIGAEANLVDVHAEAADRIGNSLLGGGADLMGDAAVGANADARIGLTMDALKGRLTGDVGGDAFAGASAGAQGSLEGDLGAAKTAIVGSTTAYAGVGVGLQADGNFDLLHGKFSFDANIGAALGVGAKFDLGMNVDVSGVPHAIEDAGSSVVHTITNLIPSHVSIGPILLW